MEKIITDLRNKKIKIIPTERLSQTDGIWFPVVSSMQRNILEDDQILIITRLSDNIYVYKYVHTANFIVVKCKTIEE